MCVGAILNKKGHIMKNFVKILTACAIAALLAACAGPSPNGYTKASTPTADLEKLKADFDEHGIPCGIGIGQSSDEMIARTQSIDEAQTAVQVSLKSYVSRLKNLYAANINGESARIWEEMTVNVAMGEVSGIVVYKTITQFSEAEGLYKIYSLSAMNPEVVKTAMQQAATDSTIEESFKIHLQAGEMQAQLEKAAEAYKKMLETK